MSFIVDRPSETLATATFEAPRGGRRRPAWMVSLTGKAGSQMQKSHGDERIMDIDGYKDRVRQMWSKRASMYDFKNDFHPPLCDQLVALGDLAPGAMRVLDVASGTGSVALSASRVLGPCGVITAIDISEAMLAKAREKAGKAGISMEYLVQDVETASFPANAFDRILCSNGMAYLQHPQATLQRLQSWLCPGGKLAFNSPLVPMVPLTDIIRNLVERDYGLKVADAGAAFGTADDIVALCMAARFKDVQITKTAELREYAHTTPEQFVELIFNMMVAFPANPLDKLLSPGELQQLRTSYTPDAIQMAEEMYTERGSIALRYTMQWAVAQA